MRLTNSKTEEVVLEFNDNNLPIFHDKSIGRELFSFGIEIPPDLQGASFNNKTIVFPSLNKNDEVALKLFKKALIEVYFNPELLDIYNLEWRN